MVEVGCGLGAELLAHRPDLEKGRDCLDCCEPADAAPRTWRKWARRNDCGVERNNLTGKLLCAPCTAAKWLVVCLVMIPLFASHLVLGLTRWFAGGALHMLTRKCCHGGRFTAAYYVLGGVPMLANYLLALLELLLMGIILITAFFIATGLSLNPICAIETAIELVRLSDQLYASLFANLPVALEHPGKLAAPCWFGRAYTRAGANRTHLPEAAHPLDPSLVVMGKPVQPVAQMVPVPVVAIASAQPSHSGASEASASHSGAAKAVAAKG
mmetsp:Transcript_12054/g.27944  ORF Transcript_12054/g.27944 Transcript_12054/m.27944 type:complete len:270 (-) Transcript_12054:49-858(-)